MPKSYCPKCGSPTEYTLQRPKFCSGCGLSLGSESVRPPVSIPSRPIPQYSPIYREEPEEFKPLTISKMEVDIQIETPTYEKLGNVIGSSPSSSPIRPVGKKMSKKQLEQNLNDFRKNLATTTRFDSPDSE